MAPTFLRSKGKAFIEAWPPPGPLHILSTPLSTGLCSCFLRAQEGLTTPVCYTLPCPDFFFSHGSDAEGGTWHFHHMLSSPIGCWLCRAVYEWVQHPAEQELDMEVFSREVLKAALAGGRNGAIIGQGQPGLQTEFQTSQDFKQVVRFCLKINK